MIAKRNGGGNGNDNGNDNGKKQKHGSEDLPLQRQTEAGFAALGVGAIFQGEFAAVGFGDLAAEDQADAGAVWLGGEEGDEEIGGVGDAGAVVEDAYVDVGALARPGDLHAASRF